MTSFAAKPADISLDRTLSQPRHLSSFGNQVIPLAFSLSSPLCALCASVVNLSPFAKLYRHRTPQLLDKNSETAHLHVIVI
jgi:hypothetical protein